MDCDRFLHKNRISFDVNQLIVCEHTRFVRENRQNRTNYENKGYFLMTSLMTVAFRMRMSSRGRLRLSVFTC